MAHRASEKRGLLPLITIVSVGPEQRHQFAKDSSMHSSFRLVS
jgi:hypothetical protein